MEIIGKLIVKVLDGPNNETVITEARNKFLSFAKSFH